MHVTEAKLPTRAQLEAAVAEGVAALRARGIRPRGDGRYEIALQLPIARVLLGTAEADAAVGLARMIGNGGPPHVLHGADAVICIELPA